VKEAPGWGRELTGVRETRGKRDKEEIRSEVLLGLGKNTHGWGVVKSHVKTGG